MNDPRLDFLRPYFVGPAAENGDLLERLVVEFLRDHHFWRRNFHPEDGQRIDAGARNEPEFLDFEARTRAALFDLSARLKKAVPFFHPRYVGHMTGDLLIPGMVAKIVTTLYNPNNVSEEAAPVTVEMELEVGRQLARMFGFAVDPAGEPCAWGHLTGGGTVANYEALWNFRSLKFYPLALREACRETGVDPDGVGPGGRALTACDTWELVNLSIDQVVALRRRVADAVRAELTRRERHAFVEAVRRHRIETLGSAEFFQEHPDLRPPVVLVSASAHYSWEKGMKLLGLGRANLWSVRVDDHMRMDPGHLDELLAGALEAGPERRPVLAVVGMLGTTEFGTVDPIHRIVEVRDAWRSGGADFGVHVDGAWGGYLTAVFRRPDGSLRPRGEVREGFDYFPSQVLYEAFAALSQVDSVTVDPHKLGYLPYPAGAFVARNREVVDFVAQEAAYVFDVAKEDAPVSRDQKLHHLGQYILEGSKPGASAAAVYVTHRVLPPHAEGLGRLLGVTVRACERFYDSSRRAKERLADRVRLVVPFEPDSNLICLALNPVDNDALAVMNRFSRAVFAAMRVDPERPVQIKEFIGSYTSLLRETLPGEQAHRVLRELGIDETTFVQVPENEAREADHVFILRHTLMNPWLLAGPGEGTYIDAYWDHLERLVDSVLADPAWAAGT